MQRNNIKQDWERIVCLGAFLIILLAAGLGVSLWLRETNSGNASREIIPAVPRYLDLDKLNLFDKKNGVTVDKNPMAFVKKNTMIPARPQNRPKDKPAPPQPKKTPEPKKSVKKVTKPAVPVKKKTAVKKTAPAPPPKPAKPAPPPRVITVVYTGIYRGLQKKNSAFVEIKDSKGNRSYSAVVGAGERIAGLLEITDITDNALKLQRPGKTASVVRRDEVWKVEIHE